MSINILNGDCLEILPTLEANSVHAVVTDPPYHLTDRPNGKGGFMGKSWDGGNIAFQADLWREVVRVLKPGGYLLAFGGSRTYHRLACAVEDAGFILHPMIGWIFGQGFPKATDLSKAFDKALGAEREIVGFDPTCGLGINRNMNDDNLCKIGQQGAPITAPATVAGRQWSGWYYGRQSLKPALEPICMAQKPPDGQMVDNVLKHGCGGVNVDGCRIGTFSDMDPEDFDDSRRKSPKFSGILNGGKVGEYRKGINSVPDGRWPANLAHDGSPEVIAEFPQTSSGMMRAEQKRNASRGGGGYHGSFPDEATAIGTYGDSSSAARFFYCAKSSPADRMGTKHPTTKPTALIEWLAKLVTPPGGIILDPFAGSGTLAVAAIRLGFDAILIERESEYIADIKRRIAVAALPLFDEAAYESA